MVGPPKVINKIVNDKLLEPYEVNFLIEMFFFFFLFVRKQRMVDKIERRPSVSHG